MFANKQTHKFIFSLFPQSLLIFLPCSPLERSGELEKNRCVPNTAANLAKPRLPATCPIEFLQLSKRPQKSAPVPRSAAMLREPLFQRYNRDRDEGRTTGFPFDPSTSCSSRLRERSGEITCAVVRAVLAAALASNMQSGSARPKLNPKRKPARNESPAPVTFVTRRPAIHGAGKTVHAGSSSSLPSADPQTTLPSGPHVHTTHSTPVLRTSCLELFDTKAR